MIHTDGKATINLDVALVLTEAAHDVATYGDGFIRVVPDGPDHVRFERIEPDRVFLLDQDDNVVNTLAVLGVLWLIGVPR